MVDRYAKFATENLLVAASRIAAGRDASVIEMSRFRHGQKDKRPAISGKPLFLLVGPE